MTLVKRISVHSHFIAIHWGVHRVVRRRKVCNHYYVIISGTQSLLGDALYCVPRLKHILAINSEVNLLTIPRKITIRF